jgi:hypothetical protein
MGVHGGKMNWCVNDGMPGGPPATCSGAGTVKHMGRWYCEPCYEHGLFFPESYAFTEMPGEAYRDGED